MDSAKEHQGKKLAEVALLQQIPPFASERDLGSESRRVRVETAWLLGELRDKRAVEPLTQVLKDEDEEVRITADKALKKITRKASQ